MLGFRFLCSVFLGGYGEPRPSREFIYEFVGRGSWEQGAALVAVSDCVVAIDSAWMHIALRLEKPVVSLWGPTSPEWILSKYARHSAVVGVCEKQPCGRYECAGRECMKSIRVDDVVGLVSGVVNGSFVV